MAVSNATYQEQAESDDPDKVVGDCTCSLIAPLWIIIAEHCARDGGFEQALGAALLDSGKS